MFLRLLTNFTWWVNRKDPDGRNLFQGGFLGLDNIGIFDRSAPLPGGGTLQQADGTAWMALYCQWMLQIAIELGREDPTYNDIALKFIRHFAWIAIALNPPGADTPLWDEEDGFFYDVMRMPDGTAIPLKVRSLVGLLPLCAATVFEADASPELVERALAFAEQFGDVVPGLAHVPGANRTGRRMLALVTDVPAAPDPVGHARRGRVPRAARHPGDLAPPPRRAVRVRLGRCSTTRSATCRRSPTAGMFGGNSNWRGPVWFPMNLVIMRALFHLHRYYGDDFKVECPTGSGRMLNLRQVSVEIGRRLSKHVPARRGRAAAGVRRDREVPDRPALARPDPVPRVLPRRQRRRARRQPPDRVDGHRRAAARARAVTIYEINTAAWLAGRTLDEVSWDDIPDVDAVWLMGVWQRSPVGREISLETYPELRTEDVIGSPYCVRDYVVDERFGGPEALAHARARARRAAA